MRSIQYNKINSNAYEPTALLSNFVSTSVINLLLIITFIIILVKMFQRMDDRVQNQNIFSMVDISLEIKQPHHCY